MVLVKISTRKMEGIMLVHQEIRNSPPYEMVSPKKVMILSIISFIAASSCISQISYTYRRNPPGGLPERRSSLTLQLYYQKYIIQSRNPQPECNHPAKFQIVEILRTNTVKVHLFYEIIFIFQPARKTMY